MGKRLCSHVRPVVPCAELIEVGFVGRFMTPDWAATAVAVPYADFGNPQSLNLYSYVKNNPTTVTDPNGHCTSGGQTFRFIAAAANAYENGDSSFIEHGFDAWREGNTGNQ